MRRRRPARIRSSGTSTRRSTRARCRRARPARARARRAPSRSSMRTLRLSRFPTSGSRSPERITAPLTARSPTATPQPESRARHIRKACLPERVRFQSLPVRPVRSLPPRRANSSAGSRNTPTRRTDRRSRRTRIRTSTSRMSSRWVSRCAARTRAAPITFSPVLLGSPACTAMFPAAAVIRASAAAPATEAFCRFPVPAVRICCPLILTRPPATTIPAVGWAAVPQTQRRLLSIKRAPPAHITAAARAWK